MTLLPCQLLADPAMRRSLSPVVMHAAMPAWNVAVVYRSRNELSPVCQAFLDELRSVARQIIAGAAARA